MLTDHDVVGDGLWRRFSSPTEQVWRPQSLADIDRRHLGGPPVALVAARSDRLAVLVARAGTEDAGPA